MADIELVYKLMRDEGFEAVKSIQFQCEPWCPPLLLFRNSLLLLVLVGCHSFVDDPCIVSRLAAATSSTSSRITTPIVERTQRREGGPHRLAQHISKQEVEETEHRIHDLAKNHKTKEFCWAKLRRERERCWPLCVRSLVDS
ncbi:hypothetical protein CJ030_MR7G017737 [Morella rubra]|uniref:Uncharacterized protein n=1 Tax=Morella rubra TaxID=262757 RepID=A0A6A1V9B4_9ROSI|nr:hypothetical protein CJ030_MR7G017737 [Morella rubra]